VTGNILYHVRQGLSVWAKQEAALDSANKCSQRTLRMLTWSQKKMRRVGKHPNVLNTHTHTTFGSGTRLQHVGTDDWWLQKWRKMCLKVLTVAKSPNPGEHVIPLFKRRSRKAHSKGRWSPEDEVISCTHTTATPPPLQIYSAKGTPVTAAKRKLLANVNLRNCWSTCCTPPKY